MVQGLYLLIAPLGQVKTKLIHNFFFPPHPKTIRLVCLLSHTEINSFLVFLPAASDSLILNSNDPIHSIYFRRLFSRSNTFRVYDTAHCTRAPAYIWLLRDDECNAFFFIWWKSAPSASGGTLGKSADCIYHTRLMMRYRKRLFRNILLLLLLALFWGINKMSWLSHWPTN